MHSIEMTGFHFASSVRARTLNPHSHFQPSIQSQTEHIIIFYATLEFNLEFILSKQMAIATVLNNNHNNMKFAQE